MARVLGALVVGLLFGAIAGVLSHGLLFGDDGAIVTRSARASETASTSTPGPVPAIAPPTEAVRTVAASEPSPAPPETVASFVAAAKSAAAAEVRRGTRSIRGTIADRDGKPIAGAVLRSARQRVREPGRDHTRWGLTAPSSVTLDEKVRAAVEEWYAWQGDWRETTSDADGRYVLPELREGRYWVEAWHDGFALEPKSETPVRADTTLDFLATPVVPVAIDVLLPDGSTAPKASLQVRRPGEKETRRVEAWTPGQAQLALADGEWELKATLGDPEQGPTWPEYLASKAQTIQLAVAAGKSTSVTLRLEGAPGVRGDVRFLGASRPDQLIVKLHQLAAGAEPDLEQLADDSSVYSWSRNGEYSFTDVAPGRYVVGASRNWGGPITAHAIVEVGKSMVVQDLEIPALDPALCVAVKARGPDGRPLDAVTFQLEVARADGGSSSGGVESERQPDGSHLVPLDRVAKDLLEDGEGELDLALGWPADLTVTLLVKSEAHGERSIVLASSTRTVDVDFGAPARLRVKVPGYEGSGYEGRVMVSLAQADQDETRHHFSNEVETVAADGTKTLGPVAPGAWSLELHVSETGGRGWGNSVVAVRAITLAAGDNEASISIPALYALTVEGDAEEGTSYSLQRSGETAQFHYWQSQDADGGGRVVFADLVAGDYVLGCDAESGSMKVHVPTSGAVRFAAPELNALRVWLENDEGRLAGAGLEDGDLVVAIDGKEYATAEAMLAAISASLAKKQVVLALLREGKRVDLAVATSALSNPFEIGGGFQPDAR